MTTAQKEVPHVLVLRSCFKDMTCEDGYKWPVKGRIKCKKWDPSPEVRAGLHGYLWGEGTPTLSEWTDTKWLLIKVLKTDIVNVGTHVKFPKGEVLISGTIRDCTDQMAEMSKEITDKHVIGLYKKLDKDHVKLSGGVKSVLEAGSNSSLVGGDRSILKGGNHATLIGGHLAALTAGENATMEAGNYSLLTAGNNSNLKAGYQSVLRAGHKSTLVAGSGSSLYAGENSNLLAGDGSSMCGGVDSTLTWKIGKKTYTKNIKDVNDSSLSWICVKGHIERM